MFTHPDVLMRIQSIVIEKQITEGASNMEATLQTVSSTMTVIRDAAEIGAALNNELTVAGKRVLVTRGADTAKTVEYIYKAFAAHKDLSGENFMLSRQHKGLVHRDKWGSISKVTAYDLRNIWSIGSALPRCRPMATAPTYAWAESLPP